MKYSSILQAFKLIIQVHTVPIFFIFSHLVNQEEGFFALWKGNLSATYLWITYAIVQFSVYGILKRLSEKTAPPTLNEKTGKNC